MRRLTLLLLICTFGVLGHAQEWRAIDTAKSTLTIRAFKNGLFSGFSHNHEIRANIAEGRISLAPEAVELRIETARLQVLDPDLPADKRAEVQQRMLSEDVLDAGHYPSIAFRSRSARKTGADAWDITGDLTLHGQTHPVSVQVTQVDGAFRGRSSVRQRQFGMKPASVAGGTVKVKDEVAIEFDVRLAQ
jgi:polyisoprenoid-binding protein YceI